MSEWAIITYIQAVKTLFFAQTGYAVLTYLLGLYLGYKIGKSEGS